MLIGHASATDQTLCMREIAQHGGYETFNSANLHYGSLAGKLTEALAIPHPRFLVYCLATFFGDPDKQETQAQMHPELYEALIQLGWIPEPVPTPSTIELSASEQALPETERAALIKARIGQPAFRERLLEYWGGCAVTGCNETKLLLASHIKPWAKASSAERRDPYNGLLLSPSLDRAFDQCLISFDSQGHILLSRKLDGISTAALNITPHLQLCRIDLRHRPYLAWHREYLFRE